MLAMQKDVLAQNSEALRREYSIETLYRTLRLSEGCGVRSTARLNQVHTATVLRVLKLAGERAEVILDRELRDIRAEQIQIDKLWTFVQKKDKRVRPTDAPEIGDA